MLLNEKEYLWPIAREVYGDTRNFYIQMSESIFMILGGGGLQTPSDFNSFMTNIDSYQQSDESVLFNEGDPLYFTNLVFNNYMDWENTVGNNIIIKQSANLQFSEYRYVNNFNFRKDKNEDVIQGKLGGKWYDLELNRERMAYEMTASARRDFENNNSNSNDREGGGGGDW